MRIKTRITFSPDNFIIVNGKQTHWRVRRGEYRDTPDNRLGRWYIDNTGSDEPFAPFGKGWPTRLLAAEQALQYMMEI